MHKIILSALTLAASAILASAEDISLNGRWTLDYWEQPREAVLCPEQLKDIQYETIEATVPGDVILDLYAAGKIPNPELGSNVYLLRPYEGYQWRYSREFTTPSHTPDDYVTIDFDGIDTFAEIYLNGRHLGSTANMLIDHEFDITSYLNPIGQSNRLEVIIRSAVIEGRKQIPPTISFNFAQMESHFARRAPHTYGWDIMPRLVSAGLWREVEIEVKKPVHIRDAHWFTTKVNTAASTATLYLDYTVNLPIKYQEGKTQVEITLSRNGKTIEKRVRPIISHAAREQFYLSDVDYWWPRGYGEPALYDATVRVLDAQGTVWDSNSRKIGIRTIKLDYTEINTPDSPGRFAFIVNGEKVYVHGSNWTPMDALHSRDPQHLEAAINIAKDLNCNMLRCWGGNVYEDHEFFRLCDANGIMIWQDFAMGCTMYSQGHEFQQQIAQEVRNIALKLRSHPCLALWAGNNENDIALASWSLADLGLDPNHDVVSRVTLPSVLYEMDPTITYLPSSPFVSAKAMENGFNDYILPENHLWGPRGYYRDGYYLGAKCLFVSEIGYHGMPNRESLEKMFPKESVYPWSDVKNRTWNNDWLTKSVRVLEHSGYTPDRNNLMLNQVRLLFGTIPTDLDDFIFASQSVQAEAMKFFIERFRGSKFEPYTGMLWWNIRDGWPLISDAIVDFYNSPKMAYYFIRNSQKDVCCMMNDAQDGSYPLIVANDTLSPQSGSVSVVDVKSGKKVFEGRYNVAANGRALIASIPVEAGQGLYKISYTGRDGEALSNHYLYGEAPFDLKEYRSLLKKSKLYEIK